MNWSQEGAAVRDIVAEMQRRGHAVTAQQVANALTAPRATVASAMEAVIQASRATSQTLDILSAREAEREQEKQLAELGRDLAASGYTALVNDGEVTGLSGAPYFKQSPAEKTAPTPDLETQLKSRKRELERIVADPATSVLMLHRATQELADVNRRLEMLSAMKARLDTGM